MSTVDLCEIARNSVRQSSFEEILKKHWIGDNYDSGKRNANGTYNKINMYIIQFIISYVLEPNKTNVPDSRFHYRFDALTEELAYLKSLSEMK